jgi:hypothetical protein
MAAVVRKEVKCGAPGRIPSELAEDYAFKLNIVRFAGAVRWSLNLEREDPGGGGLPGPVVITLVGEMGLEMSPSLVSLLSIFLLVNAK